MSDDEYRFILFLDPMTKEFYSFCQEKGIIIKQQCPSNLMAEAKAQLSLIQSLVRTNDKSKRASFKNRPLPSSVLIESETQLPSYVIKEAFAQSRLEKIRFNSEGILQRGHFMTEINTEIRFDQLPMFLEGPYKLPDKVEITINIQASIDEVLRTITRVVMQNFNAILAPKSPKAKLVLRFYSRDEYLSGKQSLINFVHVRDCLRKEINLRLQLIELQQLTKASMARFVFYRPASEVKKGVFLPFIWSLLLQKDAKSEFLIWHLPNYDFIDPKTDSKPELWWSEKELVRNKQRLKAHINTLQRQEKRKCPRFIWKKAAMTFLIRRRKECAERLICPDGNLIYSGECQFQLTVRIKMIEQLFTLLNKGEKQLKETKKPFLRFNTKEFLEDLTQSSSLPSAVSRYRQLAELKKSNTCPIIPFMTSIHMELWHSGIMIHRDATDSFVAANSIVVEKTLTLRKISLLPMECYALFRIKIWSREGEGFTFGIAVIKIFDEFGYLRQGQHQVALIPMQAIDPNKLGCLDSIAELQKNSPRIVLQFPTFMKPVIWTLQDNDCLKALGYIIPPSLNEAFKNTFSQRLNELLRADIIGMFGYSAEDKRILRLGRHLYQNQPFKLINYLMSVNWAEPAQVIEAYEGMNLWASLPALPAILLLNPRLTDEYVRYFAVKAISKMSSNSLVFFSNQLVQALVCFETDQNPLIELIIEKCCQEPYSLAHQYFWQFYNRTFEPTIGRRFSLYLQTLLMVSPLRESLGRSFMINNALVSANTRMVETTQSLSFEEKSKKFKSLVPGIEGDLLKISPEGFRFPIRPEMQFTKIDVSESQIFDSKKLPFSLGAKTTNQLNSKSIYRVIFKCGDDIRQDHLVLEMFRFFDDLWCQAGLDFKMNLYRVLPTGPQVGFIEVVDYAVNNSKIHKDYSTRLVDSFDEKTTIKFLTDKNRTPEALLVAKENYTRSCAGYLVATYVMGIGDRHSGNIMVQNNGCMFHIDFGHILGNFKMKFNIKRERTPVLFTSEFAEVMGGKDSKAFERFEFYCTTAYNILRRNGHLIIGLLAMMVSADIPQIKSYASLDYIRQQLDLPLTEAQASEKMVRLIRETLDHENSRKIDNAFHEVKRVG